MTAISPTSPRLRVGSLVFTTCQGLGFLARDLHRHGVITDVITVAHGRREEHPEWYPGSHRVGNLHHPAEYQKMLDFCAGQDLMLFLETPFNWSLISDCRKMGVPTALMVMHECTPEVLPQAPNFLLCPSLLDLRTCREKFPTVPAVQVQVPVPDWVLAQARNRGMSRGVGGIATTFVHNAGNGGLRGRNGTYEVVEAWKHVTSKATLLLRVQDGSLLSSNGALHATCFADPRITYQCGTTPCQDLYKEGDVFIFPEKFNGLSLPLQEAHAAGMMVLATNRFPVNTWLPTTDRCHAINCIRYRRYCEVSSGASMEMAADGSPTTRRKFITEPDPRCDECGGTGVVPVLIPTSGSSKQRVAGRFLAYEESSVDPRDIAAKVDYWYGRSISDLSDQGLAWGRANSWDRLASSWIDLLNTIYSARMAPARLLEAVRAIPLQTPAKEQQS